MLRNLNQTKPRGRILGTPKSGVLGSSIPSSGANGPGYVYNDLSLPADANKEICGYVTTWPSAGNFFPYPDTSFTFTDAPPGTYTFQYQLSVDGVNVGSPATVTLQVGAGATTINATVGAAVAGGSTAQLHRTIAAQAGTASATGLTASITTSVGTTISATVGSASAAGQTASLLQDSIIRCSAGAASAQGGQAVVSGFGYVRAPAGPGYVPQRHECGCRPFVTQRNHR